MSARPRSEMRRESGFTLVELLVAISCLGIVMTALGAGFSFFSRATGETSNRLAGSTDAQHLAIYLPPDVQSATAAVTSGISCTNAANPVLQLTDGSAPTFNVVYGVRTITGGFQLERYVCTGGSVSKTTVVARDLAGTASAVGACVPAGTCSGTGFLGASLTVTEKTVSTDPTAYAFTVTGRRRSS